MFNLAYTKEHLLIYARKVFYNLDLAIQSTGLSQDQQTALRTELAHVNNMILALEDNNSSTDALTLNMFYHFLGMFNNSVRSTDDIDHLDSIKLRLKNFKQIDALIKENSERGYFLIEMREVEVIALDQKNLNTACELAIKQLNELSNSFEEISGELRDCIASRIKLIEDIQKFINTQYFKFSPQEFYPYSIILMETNLDLLHIKKDLNVADFCHRTEDLQLWLNQENIDKSNDLILKPLPDDNICEWLTTMLDNIRSWFSFPELGFNAEEARNQVTSQENSTDQQVVNSIENMQPIAGAQLDFVQGS